MVEKTSGAKKWFPNICLRNRRISLSRTVIHNSLQQCQPLNSLLIKNTFSRILRLSTVILCKQRCQASAHLYSRKAIISFSAILMMISLFSCARKQPCAPASLYLLQEATLQGECRAVQAYRGHSYCSAYALQ